MNEQYVSRDPVRPDSITVNINENLFKDPITGTVIDATQSSFQEELPRQMDPAFAEEFTSSVESANDAGASFLGLNVLVQLVLRQSLKSMWGMVNILQFIVYYHIIKASLAAHSRQVLEALKVIALGEFIPYEWIMEKARAVFGLEEDG